MEKLGIIGGLGPMATVYFMKKIIRMTDAQTDQEHIAIAVDHRPTIPDRTRFLLGLSDESPLPQMAEAGCALASVGCTQIAIPCVTAHCFRDELKKMVPIHVKNGVTETVDYLRECGIRRVGVMATDGTVHTGIFTEAFAGRGGGIGVVYPDGKRQRFVTELIYDSVKAGAAVDMDKWNLVVNGLVANGAEIIILGCTELGVIGEDMRLTKFAMQETTGAGQNDVYTGDSSGVRYLDVMDVLAYNCVNTFGKLKPVFKKLF